MLERVFALYGITHGVTPIKEAWLALTWISVLLKLILARRCGYSFPGLASHMIATALSGALQATHIWGLWGETLYTGTAILFAIETAFIASGGVLHQTERRYIRGFVLSVGTLGVCVLIYTAPEPAPHWPHGLYYMHLITAQACFMSMLASALFHWKRHSLTWREHCWPAVAWFGVTVWAGSHLHPADFWMTAIPGIIVQVGCLIAWFISTRGAI